MIANPTLEVFAERYELAPEDVRELQEVAADLARILNEPIDLVLENILRQEAPE